MILDTIVAHKREELKRDKEKTPFQTLKSEIPDLPPTRDFRAALATPGAVNLIAEVKRKSPSKGIIREDFDPIKIAKTYAENGASAISVLTDHEFFGGDLSYLTTIRNAVELPLLRKDFTTNEYHIYQARVSGADAVLLIVAILSPEQLREFIGVAKHLNLAALVEVHTHSELDIALDAEAEIIGINNRDLKTFHTDTATSFHLRKSIPDDKIVVSESGIYTREDVIRLGEADMDAILVGESLVRSADIGAKVRELLGMKGA
ncbi:MAG: indole-3-glycerol phosphate synthase TrpC [Candidatus Poribacteria bacterium]|nr:indole-3-glycerol phosphate synthase TrpC [Candidatus Poribacteria bacterium]MDE0504914.1 indole-3-glycerol phosphate synthase TrpC [Candidatus Poribacteria bacterium]